MDRRKDEDEDDIEEPGIHVTKAPGWETETVSQKVQAVLDSLEITKIDPEVRKTLQRQLYRKDKYLGEGGRGEITLLLRTIVESEGNQDALIEPIVSAVAMCMMPQWTNLGLAWIEAFDQLKLTEILQTMRSLDLFSEQSIGRYFSIALKNKLFKILGPTVAAEPAKPARVKAGTKLPKRRPAEQPARRMAA
jgi:hypothetical protein